jgi:phosphate starvation-inducible PhoH-like protein
VCYIYKSKGNCYERFYIKIKIKISMNETTIHLEGINPVDFFGINNSKLEILRRTFPEVKINARGSAIKLLGNQKDREMLEEKIYQIISMIERYGKVSDRSVESLVGGDESTNQISMPDMTEDVIVYGTNGHVVKSRTENQKKLVAAADKNDVVFAIGPAGTGKTYTAVALAVRALKNKWVKKIVLTRPAVEAGESLGFLPGDLKEKIDPYLRPLYDALDDMIPADKLQYYMANRVIEIAPLAFMRGRTLDNAFIILDEAQNTTDLQLKMLLTRIGPNAKAIITGDLSQVDLPKYQRSGLYKALDILKDIDGIGIIRLGEGDVVRHRLVKQIIRAYDTIEESEESQKK